MSSLLTSIHNNEKQSPRNCGLWLMLTDRGAITYTTSSRIWPTGRNFRHSESIQDICTVLISTWTALGRFTDANFVSNHDVILRSKYNLAVIIFLHLLPNFLFKLYCGVGYSSKLFLQLEYWTHDLFLLGTSTRYCCTLILWILG